MLSLIYRYRTVLRLHRDALSNHDCVTVNNICVSSVCEIAQSDLHICCFRLRWHTHDNMPITRPHDSEWSRLLMRGTIHVNTFLFISKFIYNMYTYVICHLHVEQFFEAHFLSSVNNEGANQPAILRSLLCASFVPYPDHVPTPALYKVPGHG